MAKSRHIHQCSINEIKNHFSKEFPNIEKIEIKRGFVILYAPDGYSAQYPLELVIKIKEEK